VEDGQKIMSMAVPLPIRTKYLRLTYHLALFFLRDRTSHLELLSDEWASQDYG